MIFLAVRTTTDWDSMNGATGSHVEIGLIEADNKEDAKKQLGEDRYAPWGIYAPGEFAEIST